MTDESSMTDEAGTTDALVVAHVSDLHLGAHVPATVASLADEVAAFAPDLTVVTGDHTMRARPREFLQAADLIGKLPAPRLVVPGNHDLPLVSPLRAIAPYARYRRWIGDDNPAVHVPGLTALGINSMPRWRWKNGLVTPGQLARVRLVLGGAPASDVRLLALHHPLSSLLGRARLVDALRDSRVDLVLAGHVHVPSARQDGTLFVTAGTATSYRIRKVPRSWTLLRLTPSSITVSERFEGSPGTWCTGRVARFSRLAS